MLTSAKLSGSRYSKGIFCETAHVRVGVLSTESHVSSIILMTFRRGNFAPPPTPTSKRTPKKPTPVGVNPLKSSSIAHLYLLKTLENHIQGYR